MDGRHNINKHRYNRHNTKETGEHSLARETTESGWTNPNVNLMNMDKKNLERHCISNQDKNKKARTFRRKRTNSSKSTYLPRRAWRKDRSRMEEEICELTKLPTRVHTKKQQIFTSSTKQKTERNKWREKHGNRAKSREKQMRSLEDR